jgi:hypothetical protein
VRKNQAEFNLKKRKGFIFLSLLFFFYLSSYFQSNIDKDSFNLFALEKTEINELIRQYKEAISTIEEANMELENLLGIPHITSMPADTPEKEIERRREIINIQYREAEQLLDYYVSLDEEIEILQAIETEGFIVVDGGERRYFDNNIEKELFYRIKESFVGNILVVRKYNTNKKVFEKEREYGFDTLSKNIKVENFYGKVCTKWSYYVPKSCTRYSNFLHFEIDKGELYPNFYAGVVDIIKSEKGKLEIKSNTPEIVFYTREGIGSSNATKVGCTSGNWTISNEEFEQLLKTGSLKLIKHIENPGKSSSCVAGSTITLYLKVKKDEPEKCKGPQKVKLEILSPSEGERYIFTEQNQGSLTIELKAKTIPAKYEESIEWEIPEMEGSNITLQPSSGLSNPKGAKVKVTYDGLPTHTESFGRQKVKARLKVDGCSIEETKEVLIFYPRDEKNNPQGKYPNWFYYWKQTPAAMPFGQNVRLSFHCEDMPIDKCVCLQQGIVGQYNPYYSLHKTINVCDLNRNLNVEDSKNFTIRLPAIKLSIPSTLQNRNFFTYTHIDTFAVIVMHEFTHFNNAHTFWTDGYVPEKDKDGDTIPDHIEPELGLNPKDKLTYWKDMLQGTDDEELLTLEATYDYKPGKFDQYDWGKPGKNWK